MEALGALAVAERDIRALSTARADRARSGDHGPAARDPASPFQSARKIFCGVGYRTFHGEAACATYFVPGGLKGRGSLAFISVA